MTAIEVGNTDAYQTDVDVAAGCPAGGLQRIGRGRSDRDERRRFRRRPNDGDDRRPGANRHAGRADGHQRADQHPGTDRDRNADTDTGTDQLPRADGDAGADQHANPGTDGQQIDLLVNTTDPYEGIVPMDFRSGEQTTRLQISSSGEWYIEIRPLGSVRRVSAPGTIEGTGDDVFILDGEPDTALITGNADARHFAVIAYGEQSNLLVNTTDPYDGRVIVASDTVVIEVTAVGSWSITFE